MAADEGCKPEVNEPEVLPVDTITKFSNYRRLLRVTAYMLRFIFHRRNSHTSLHILANELQKAELVWIRLVQRQFYRTEMKALQSGKSISSSSIYSLDPVLDENGLLRVKTRLQEASMGYEAEFPAIIPKNCYFSKLIVLDVHERVLHGGVNTTLVRIREKFWILRARQLVKSTLAKCGVCKRLKGKPAVQPFAPLPRSRLNASRPFETTGIDFAGPLYAKLSDGDIATSKVYILLFTCATVRAIHLELVPSLNNDSCILAIKRFISRRGTPKRFISDNARTFKRASKDLKQLGDIVYSEQLQGFISNHGIEWSFIAERAPWWGGFWERLVKSVKEILRVTVGRSTLTSEQLHTFLTEAEYMVNSRPLSYISDDPLDLSPLTPAHFLLGCFSMLLQVDTSKIQDNDLRSAWKTRLRSTHIFIKRWRTEYLQQLRSTHHSARLSSTDINVGDVVLLHDSSLPRVLWKLARVESTFPGRDGRIRACEVRLANGSKFRRAVQLLYPLELSNNIADSPGGGC